jgi:hypothetical protein
MNIGIGVLAIALGCSAVFGSPAIETMTDEQLRIMVIDLKGEVDSLRAEQNEDWLTQERAEQVRGLVADVLADADTRSNLQGSGIDAGYDKGFFLASSDGNFKLKINSQLQIRWSYNKAGNQGDAYGFEVRRSKLKFSGHVVDPSWGYDFSIVSNRQNVQFSNIGGTPTHPSNIYLENAYINKKFDNGLYFKVGQMKAPFLREELVSSTKQLAVERSMVNNAFTWTRTQGALLGWKHDSLKIEGMYNEGPNNINSQASAEPGKQGLTARAELLVGGDSDWSMFNGFNAKHTNGKTGFMLGAGVGWFNGRGTDNVQEYGNGDVNRSIAWTVDGSVAGDGWTAFTYFAWADGKQPGLRTSTPPVVRDTQRSWGWVVQGGFLIAADFELFTRYELGDINGSASETFGGASVAGTTMPRRGENKDLSALTTGMNWFINPNLKLTMDWGYAFNPVQDGGNQPTSADYTSSGTGWRADRLNQAGSKLEDGQWLLRAQMQLTF